MRAGKFDLPTHQQESMWICPKHRYNLGGNWRPLKTCQYPLHSGARKKLKNKDVVNLQMSKNIQTIFGVTIPIGSGKRVSFNNYNTAWNIDHISKSNSAGYPNHCQQDESTCPDHCLKFGLSDPNDLDLKEQCAHEHTTSCGEYDDITICLDKIEHM